MTAPSGAWLLLDRDSRPPVALPVPRQACLGLARAVLFQGEGWQQGAAAVEAAWQAAWERAGGDPAAAVCLAAWRQELAEGSPLTFTLCRRQLLPYQAWVRRRVGGRRGRFRIVAGGKAHSHLCVTAYPPHGDEAE